MMTVANDKLRTTCRLLEAACAGWVVRQGERWIFKNQYGLNKKQQLWLLDWFNSSSVSAWLAGAQANNRMRSRQLGQFGEKFSCERIFLFPNPPDNAVLIIGADQLDQKQKQLLKLVASYGPEKDADAIFDLESGVHLRNLELSAEPAYDLQEVLRQVLQYLIEITTSTGGWIALRTGSNFVVSALFGADEQVLGQTLNSEHTPWLRSLVDQRQGVRSGTKRTLHLPVPDHVAQDNAYSMAVPIVLGQRVIACVLFWRGAKIYSPADIQRAMQAASRTAHLVENAIVFSEATRYLQQLALINELATAASSGSDINEVADRVVHRLRRVFPEAEVQLFILSTNQNWLREFGLAAETSPASGESRRIPLEGTLPGYVVQSEKTLNLNSETDLPMKLLGAQQFGSMLAVPLRYRGRVIGALMLTSSKNKAFSRQDEQLLVMVAGHLAGLVENVRLTDDMRKRARNLSLIHAVVQRIVGLTNPAEIAQVAASMAAEQFDYDLAGIFLLNEATDQLQLVGISGSLPGSEDIRMNYPLDTVVLGEVLESGQSRIIADLSRFERRHSLSGEAAGSEICVRLQGSQRPIGLIDAYRQRPYAFSEDDLLALEALGGVLSSVLANAYRYQELQTSVRQLEAARETGLEIAGDLDLDILLRRVVRRARELIGARGAELALVDDTAEIVRTVVSDNPWRDFTGTEVPFMSGVEGKVAVLGEPVVVDDYNLWSGRLYPERHVPYHAMAGIPLKLKGKVIGVLVVSDDRLERVFEAQDLQLLEFFAAQAAVFIRNARLYQEIQDRMEAQRQAEMQLVRSARLAAVGEMAAGVAHELNNPLTTVAGFIELVLDELPQDFAQREDLELVLREAQRARGVVRRLLDFSRPSDNLRIHTDINELVSEVLTLVQHLIRTNGVELHVDLRADLPWIGVDPNQIKQVLLNLVHNALQAMPRGGTLKVRSVVQQRDGDRWMTVAVEDNGEGIKPQELERIFEPFFTTRPVGSGTGLGLSVSFGIINEHGGFIEVESEPEQGSCFTVWLPVNSDG